ncbi:MAG: HlyD family efflux transporter periplasmic adaptor subunit [Pseudomonadota bacterium]
MGLFRREVADELRNSLYGEVVVTPQIKLTFITTAIVTVVAVAGFLLFSAEIARSETVLGWLEPRGGLVDVFANNDGRISSLMVSDGDQVEKGDVLLLVDGRTILSDGQTLEEIVRSEYRNQLTLLNSSLVNLKTLAKEKHGALESSRNSITEQAKWVDSQLLTIGKRQDIVAKKMEQQLALLERNMVSRASIDDLEERDLEIRGTFEAVSAAKKDLQNQLYLNSIRLADLEIETEREANSIRKEISALTQAIAKSTENSVYSLITPVDGIVTGLKAKEGDEIVPGRRLLSVMPSSSEMLVRLLIPSRSVGFVHEGQSIQIRYDAFPHQKFGLHQGKILGVSESISLVHELADTPVSISEPAFEVTAALEDKTVRAYGKQHALRVGMTLSADINLENRSLFEWLLDPILSLNGRI